METTVILVVACLLAGAGIGAWLVSLRPQTRPNTTPAPAPQPTVGNRLVAEAAGTKAVRLAHGAPTPPEAGGESLVEGGLFRPLPGGGFEWQEYKPAKEESVGERIDRLERDFLASQPRPAPSAPATDTPAPAPATPAPASPDPATDATAPPPVLTIAPAGTAPAGTTP